MTAKRDIYGRKIESRVISGKNYRVGPEKRKYTRYKQNPLTGRFMGRYTNVPARLSDNTRYIRMTRSLDVNNDDIIDLNKGQVIGRLKKGTSEIPSTVKVKVHLSNERSYQAMKNTQKEKFRKILDKLRHKKSGDGRFKFL